MPKRDETILVVVDVQERLLPHIRKHEEMTEATVRLIRGCQALGIPIVVTEQYPQGLGPTTPPVKAEIEPWAPIVKASFSCCGEGAFNEALRSAGRKDVLLCGIETHVCVYQTARDLLVEGYRVHLVADAVSSRRKIDRETAIRKMEMMGAEPCTVEMALFELLRVSGTDEFKAISRIVK